MKRRWTPSEDAAVGIGGMASARPARRLFGQHGVAAVPYGHGNRIEKFATIAREPGEVYAAWRNLESLPLVMPNLQRVEREGSQDSHSRWTLAGAADAPLTWEAEILVDQPGERISWRADKAPIKHAGTVRFEPAPGGNGTEVTVEIEYVPPARPLGSLAGALVHSPPERLVEVDLRRFKSVLEAADTAVNDTDVTR